MDRDQSASREEQISFICNSKLIGICALTLAFLYLSLQQHRARYFVYISIANTIIYPLLRSRKQHYLSFFQTLFRGTLLSSLAYDLWTLAYPHKIFLYYIPQVVGTVGKIYHILTYQQQGEVETVEQLIKLQSKSQIFVFFYAVLSFLFRLKYSWWKLSKLILLLCILRLKYSLHFGTQISYQELHFKLDRYSKLLSMREHYHSIYMRICPQASHTVISQEEYIF